MEAGVRPRAAAAVRRDRHLGVARRRVLAAVGLVLAGPLLLGAEVLLATRGQSPPPVPGGVDACVGCDGSGPPLRAYWLGDSTAAGVGVAGVDDVLGRQVARRLDRPVDLHVLASSGDVVADVVAHQVPRVPRDADVVFVSVGSNDATHLNTAGTFSSTYRKLLEGLPRGACVVLLGVPDLGSPPRLAQPLRAVAGWRGRALDRQVHTLARRNEAIYVDIAGATGPAFRRDRSLFAVDGYHPDGSGYALWADAVTSAMSSAGARGSLCLPMP